jgi:CheY-like chemotaxis protein
MTSLAFLPVGRRFVDSYRWLGDSPADATNHGRAPALAVLAKETPRAAGGYGDLPVQDMPLGYVRILLADDHAEFLAVVVRLLETDYEVVKTVRDGQAVVEAATRLQPDLIVLDVTMPISNGIEAVRQLRHDGFTGKIVFLTVHADADYVRAAFAAGGQGFVVKNRLASDLLPALREVLAGRTYVSPGLAC